MGFSRFSECACPPGGAETRPNLADRDRLGSKRHLAVDGEGIRLAVTQSAANMHDFKMLEARVDAIPPITRPQGRPRKPPDKLHVDKAFESIRCRRARRACVFIPRIARRGIESSQGLGCHRWVAERILSWVNQFRRLKVRHEQRADIHQTCVYLGCALMCWNALQHESC